MKYSTIAITTNRRVWSVCVAALVVVAPIFAGCASEAPSEEEEALEDDEIGDDDVGESEDALRGRACKYRAPRGVSDATPRMSCLRNAIVERFKFTNRVGCWRPCDDVVPDHPEGRACDFMMGGGQKPYGNEIAEWAKNNAAAYGVDYVIWNRRVWSVRRPVWRRYTGYNPHTDHVHISVVRGDGACPRRRPPGRIRAI